MTSDTRSIRATAGKGKAVRERRSQADRSAETRDKVLAAAIRLLHEGGYSAANIKAIASAAGVSLGSLQHQFPTKAKLMAAVVDQLARKRIEAYRAAADHIDDPWKKYGSVFDTTWSVVKEPEFAAVLEIMLARRSDQELRDETGPSFATNEATVKEWVLHLGEQAGDEVRAAEFSRTLSNTLMYGLAMQLAIGFDREEAEELVSYWKSLIRLAGRHPELLPERLRMGAKGAA
ncbi:MAG: TetR/AcrR family transcriptional regulator [Phenylobacterium sp.]|uniref:TetR/AcrR family transcriptional regulator n=1 Tax=Phenylobacterium sp. TaxID=1871053 RepID=UPI003015AD90